MVDYDPKSWFSLIFKIHKYGTVSKLLPTMIVLALLSGAYCYLEIEIWNGRFSHTMAFHSLVGFVISLLLVFRTNTAYDRWWEGRKQWGALVNNTRNLGIKLSVMIPRGFKQRRELIRILITNYVFAMKEHLREGVIKEELENHPEFDREEIMKLGHVSNGIAQRLYTEILKLRDENLITDMQLLVIDKEFKSLTDIIGACERIKKSPIPYSYNAFIKKFIFLYVISLPFGTITGFGYATVFVVVFLFYILASLELIAEEIEDPFGTDANDLPTDGLSMTIQKNLIEIFE
jgi:ion channel-forming bestrophin family protein